MTKKPAQPTQPQSDKFKAMAKELEADGDEKSFDKTLGEIAKAPPPKKAAK